MSEQLTAPQNEVQTISPDDAFDVQVQHLLSIQHKIEDIANVATRFLSEARHKYNHFLNLYSPALKAYAKDHLKRDADGQIKGKSYKSISAGGGVFFRAKPEKIRFNESKLADMKEFIERYLPDKVEVIREKTVYEVPDKQALVDVLLQIADAKARQIFTNSEQITVEQLKALDGIYRSFGIEIEESDPFHYFYVGSTKGWTGDNLKANLSQAIEGSFKLDEEEVEEISG